MFSPWYYTMTPKRGSHMQTCLLSDHWDTFTQNCSWHLTFHYVKSWWCMSDIFHVGSFSVGSCMEAEHICWRQTFCLFWYSRCLLLRCSHALAHRSTQPPSPVFQLSACSWACGVHGTILMGFLGALKLLRLLVHNSLSLWMSVHTRSRIK